MGFHLFLVAHVRPGQRCFDGGQTEVALDVTTRAGEVLLEQRQDGVPPHALEAARLVHAVAHDVRRPDGKVLVVYPPAPVKAFELLGYDEMVRLLGGDLPPPGVAVIDVDEPYAGAVLAKILVLVFIILFIQKRPRGLFALKGRSVEA